MKRIIYVFAAVALMVLAAVCLVFRPPETVLLVIEQTDWAGEKDFIPTGQTKTYEVKTGDVIAAIRGDRNQYTHEQRRSSVCQFAVRGDAFYNTKGRAAAPCHAHYGPGRYFCFFDFAIDDKKMVQAESLHRFLVHIPRLVALLGQAV